MALPEHIPYLIIGAGIHGLSTAYHLARDLAASGRGKGSDIVVVDKTGICAGATGIACGVVRNNYFQPAMRELMAHSVAIWESDPEAYSYHDVGYMQLSPESMRRDIQSIYAQQQAIGYESTLIEGEEECARYMRGLFHDWRAQGITSVLHEKRGGYANNKQAMLGLAEKATALGVTIVEGITVTGFDAGEDGSILSVSTDSGEVSVNHVVVAAGPWVRHFWQMLDLPDAVDILNPNTGQIAESVPMWTYWSLQEGTLGVDPGLQQTNDGNMPPVIHVDSDAALYSDADGQLITDEMWGIYYKPDFNFGGIQGGACPFIVDKPAEDVAVDPYGPDSAEFIVGERFAEMWVSALSHCQERFSGSLPSFKQEPSGGIGCFTPDSFPVFDTFCGNCTVIADSNHGYKMIGIGELVARELLGEQQPLLEPFRLSRFARGELHPVSNSPFPWS